MGQLLTIKQVAEKLQSCEHHVYNLIHGGDLEVTYIGSRKVKRQIMRVAEADLEKFLNGDQN